jgi:pentatricopeptide repeat protein
MADAPASEAPIRHFRKAIELNPYSATTYNNLANAYYMNGQVEEAEKAFKRALQMQRMNR